MDVMSGQVGLSHVDAFCGPTREREQQLRVLGGGGEIGVGGLLSSNKQKQKTLEKAHDAIATTTTTTTLLKITSTGEEVEALVHGWWECKMENSLTVLQKVKHRMTI